MRIVCEKGFYKFFPQTTGEITRFQTKYGANLKECDEYFTFESLASLPNFSIQGQPYVGVAPALVTYAGKREEVMTKNGLSYYQPAKKVVLKRTFQGFFKLDYNYSNSIVMNNLPQAYFYDDLGVINGFVGFVDVSVMRYKIEKFFYENP